MPAKYLPAIVRQIGRTRGDEMNRREMMTGLAMAGALLAGAYSAAASDSAEEVQVLVAKTIDYFAANGAEATIAAVNAGGAFHQGKLYVFIIGPDGTSLANAADQTNIGKDSRLLQDADGKFYGVEILERATAEGVWVDYKRLNPANGKIEPKTSWVRKIDGYVIGCGYYRSE
jgi:signal transduction histidine kinase